MSHRHGDFTYTGCTDLTPDICLATLMNTEATKIGYFFSHALPGTAKRCTGTLHTEQRIGGERVWAESGGLGGGDLTLEPSIRCGLHPELHGWVQNGRWVPA